MSYHEKTIVIASKHRKEEVIAPVFQRYWNCQVIKSDLDTDLLGTFTGEIPRMSDHKTTCRQKALEASLAANQNIVIASEGSFGPHPLIPWVPIDHEVIVLIDKERDICIQEELIAYETNYQSLVIEQGSDLREFLEKVLFPTHALCLQTKSLDQVIAKGIQTHEELSFSLEKGFALADELLLSTDMRALYNPTRMKVIGLLAEKLAQRILRCCPACQMPGFGMVDVAGSLPCQACHAPSNQYALEILACLKCAYQERQSRPDGKKNIDPQFCSFCNP